MSTYRIDFKKETDIVSAIKNATEDGLGPHGKIHYHAEDILPDAYSLLASIVTSSNGIAYEQAMEYIRPHGTVVAVGLPPNAKVNADV